jgi:predicted membrane channel-forming protein YqfA (hemolysin III family)
LTIGSSLVDFGRMKVKDIELPKYTLAQELWNSISHGLGTVFTLIAGPFMIIKVAKTGTSYRSSRFLSLS